MGLVIGIDPDLVKSGVAVVENGRILSLTNLEFMDLIEFAMAHKDAVFVVEYVEANKPVFSRGVNQLQQLKIAQNVGMVKGAARLIIQALERAGCTVQKCKPLTGAIKKAKKDAKLFDRYTGWSGRSNEDQRDAALLAVFGYAQSRSVSLYG